MKFGIILLVLMVSVKLFSQNSSTDGYIVNYGYPLKVPVSLSGNYGELRSGHFHTGLDFRVGGASGAPIRSIERGYVSRIFVSATGYGNALYITHPNGEQSVYGHMLDFIPKIRDYVENTQYKNESFSVNIYLKKNVLVIKKNEVIGRVGNTGSSAGPHLHFEIRDKSSVPMNPIKMGVIRVKDNTSPQFRGVNFYHYDVENLISNKFKSTKSVVDEVIFVKNPFYLAVDAADKQNRTNIARLGIYRYEIYLDGRLYFGFEVEETKFAHNKYINSFIEYAEKHKQNRSYIKTFVEPGNILKERTFARNNGLFIINDSLEHKIKIVLWDEHNNSSSREFRIRLGKGAIVNSETIKIDKSIFMRWNLPNIYLSEDVKLFIPIGALYNSMYFQIDTLKRVSGLYSPIFNIHREDTPLHKSARLYIKPNSIPLRLREKAVVVNLSSDADPSYAGGHWKGEYLVAQIYSFGNYSVAIDSIPPKILPNFRNNSNLSKQKSVAFVVSDNLSGIGSYELEIDGKWTLLVYDAKSERLTLPFNQSRIKKGRIHDLKLVVVDNVGNKSIIRRKFTY